MRIWALASCSGLLALAACSADQPHSPQVDEPSPPEATSASSQTPTNPGTPTARGVTSPETNPPRLRQSAAASSTRGAALTARGRGLSPRVKPQTLTPTGSQPSLSAQALRARVQQIRAQRAKATPISLGSFSPAPVSQGPIAPAEPQARASGEDRANPVANPRAEASQTQTLNRGILQARVTPVPLPARPSPASPAQPLESQEPAVRSLLPSPEASVATPSSATALAPTESATLARNFPIRTSSHQGYSARGGTAPSLTPPAPLVSRQSDPRADAPIQSPTRVHQGANLVSSPGVSGSPSEAQRPSPRAASLGDRALSTTENPESPSIARQTPPVPPAAVPPSSQPESQPSAGSSALHSPPSTLAAPSLSSTTPRFSPRAIPSPAPVAPSTRVDPAHGASSGTPQASLPESLPLHGESSGATITQLRSRLQGVPPAALPQPDPTTAAEPDLTVLTSKGTLPISNLSLEESTIDPDRFDLSSDQPDSSETDVNPPG